MRTRVDAVLREEAARYRLVFGCERCAHFAVDTSSCGNGYPNRAHLAVELLAVESLEFCKEFELA